MMKHEVLIKCLLGAPWTEASLYPPYLKGAYSASREPFSIRIGASEAPRGAGVDSDSEIVRRIHLLAKKLSAVGRNVWTFFTCENRWI